MARDIEDLSYWIASHSIDKKFPALVGKHDADVVIVGAGFTGLWTAYFLKKIDPQIRVTLLEMNHIGSGASGRNAGMVCPGFDHSPTLSIQHFGVEESARLEKLGVQNAKDVGVYASDCDYEGNGTLNVALTPAHLDVFADIVESARQLGLDCYSTLSADKTRERIHSHAYLGGMFNTNGGILNPYKLAYKLAREFVDMGGLLYETTPVQRIANGVVHTMGGEITCDRVVLATDAYTANVMPELRHRYIPVYDYVVVSDPLTDEQHSKIGWHNREAIWDSRTFFNYYRLTADNRILWGSGEAQYYANKPVDASHDFSSGYHDKLIQSFTEFFPQLSDLRFPFCWGGPIASTSRLTPYFGSTESGRVVYGLGYTGQGVANARISGTILAHMALSKKHEYMDFSFFKKKPVPFPPQFLRGLATSTIRHELQKVDAGQHPGVILKILDRFGIEFSS